MSVAGDLIADMPVGAIRWCEATAMVMDDRQRLWLKTDRRANTQRYLNYPMRVERRKTGWLAFPPSGAIYEPDALVDLLRDAQPYVQVTARVRPGEPVSARRWWRHA